MDKQKRYTALSMHVSNTRLEKINRVAEARTDKLVVVLEDIYYTQNMSAVIRTCECLGIQNVYVIGSIPYARVNKHVALGASQWVTLHRRHKEPKSGVLTELREAGYRLCTTSLSADAVSIYDYNPIEQKTAVILGNELNGVSETALKHADVNLSIPMYGFSDSFNISVSAAIICSTFTDRLRAQGAEGLLSPDQQMELKLQWMKSSIKRADEIEREYEQRLSHPNDQ
ncbi:MAG: TrmH family RNA methyltransferase [Spirochaetia bacterium]